MDPDDIAQAVAAIYTAAWQVRYWCRPHQRERRAAAIRALGLIVRSAFDRTETNFEPLLYAIADAITAKGQERE